PPDSDQSSGKAKSLECQSSNQSPIEYKEKPGLDSAYSNPALKLGPLPHSGFNLKDQIAEVEIHYIREALEVSNGIVAQAAKLLGLRRTTLVEKLRKYGIQR
ncbi:MAG: helix-turn-helix domain-containing protein, partial [Pseudomonadota bacterium]